VEKIALFAFNGDPMCFIHVLLNALDFCEKDSEIKLVIEGSATKLIPELDRADHPLHRLYQRAKKEVLLVASKWENFQVSCLTFFYRSLFLQDLKSTTLISGEHIELYSRLLLAKH